jgi:hypothetical protein
MKQIILPIIGLAVLLQAASIEHVTKQLTGSDTSMSTGGAEIKKPETSGIYNYSEVTYEHIKAWRAKAQNPQAGSAIAFGEDISGKRAKELTARLAASVKEKQLAEAKALLPEWPRFAEGYCYVKNDVEVERIATYAYLSCDFATPLGRGELVASLVPDFYASALIAKPLYLNIMDKNRKKQRIPIVSGAILTQNKLSINIATLVNDRKIERLIAAGTYTTLDVATKQAQLYLTDASAARVKQTATTGTNGLTSNTVLTTNTEKPIASDYYLAGGLMLVSQLAKVIGDSVVNQLPYTFKVQKDTALYADIELGDTQALRGFDAVVPNIIKKQPKFDITTGTESEEDVTSIPIRPMVQKAKTGQSGQSSSGQAVPSIQ